MISLPRLSTSLTKHGAHKIAWLIKDYDPDTILTRLWGSVSGINIEEVQARKNLSVQAGNVVPRVWKVAKSKGPEVVKALVFIAIVFSHHHLISAMRTGALTRFTGRIMRGKILDRKAFTNFAHTIEELGFSTGHTVDYVDYDLSRLFKISGLNSLAVELLALKMKTAGWEGVGDVRKVLIAQKFHEVFATERAQFESWLTTGDPGEGLDSLEDSDYFLDTEPTETKGKFAFKSGHKAKKTGAVSVKTTVTSKTARLIHNYIQNKLDAQLVEKFGRDCVGCEVPTGQGTSIDIVVQTKKRRMFYEIKVAKTVKACIRQAIPQLLEYAYWAQDELAIEKLIVVSPFPLSDSGAEYLARLRTKFNLPLHYEQFIES